MAWCIDDAFHALVEENLQKYQIGGPKFLQPMAVLPVVRGRPPAWRTVHAGLMVY